MKVKLPWELHSEFNIVTALPRSIRKCDGKNQARIGCRECTLCKDSEELAVAHLGFDSQDRLTPK